MEFLRYGAASALAFAADFSILVLLTELAGVHYLTSAAVAFGVGLLIAYVLSTLRKGVPFTVPIGPER